MTPAEVLTPARALLLDFDGPVCSVFAGIPSSTVADQLRDVLADGGHTQLPEDVATSADPFDVVRFAAALGIKEARYVETALTAHELEAITSAAPANGAHDLIRAWHKSGRLLAIVSNNSARAIDAYLDLYDLRTSINCVSARNGPDVALLKPSPYLLNQATTALAVAPSECAFIGDSLSDIEAARTARIRSVGYANKPDKIARFKAAGADAVTEAMAGLATVWRPIQA